MIYKSMTHSEWEDLRKRTDAWLQTDIKEYNSGVKLLQEWLHDDFMVRQFVKGTPVRYSQNLRTVLNKLKEITNYPRLIDTKEKRDKLYIANLPVDKDKQLPQTIRKEEIAPPPVKAEWDRYADLDSYYPRLSTELQKKADGLSDMFLNRRRLHELVKRYSKENVQPELIESTLEELSNQENAIQDIYDSFEVFFNAPEKTENESQYFEVPKGSKPSGTFTKEQIERMEDPVFKALCKEKRIEANKKYINRKDVNNPSEVELRKQELDEWEVPVQ